MVRNAICENIPIMHGSKASYHCVCRPGSCGVSAGVCVEQKCTKDVAKIEGGLAAGYGPQQKEAILQAEKAQKHLDEHLGDSEAAEETHQNTVEEVKGQANEFGKEHPEEEVAVGGEQPKDQSWEKVAHAGWCGGDGLDDKATMGLADAKACQDACQAADGCKFASFQGPSGPCKIYSECDPQAMDGQDQVDTYQLKDAGEVSGEALGGAAVKIVPKADVGPALMARKLAAKKQPNMNETYAGVRGIMPSVRIPGISMSGGEDDAGDYKIKFLLPSSSTVNGAGGQVQLGNDDAEMEPIIDGLGRLTQKLEQAEKLQNTIGDGWDDIPAPMPKAPKPKGWEGKEMSDENLGKLQDENEQQKAKNDKLKGSEAEQSMPGCALVAAGLAPSGPPGGRSERPCRRPRSLMAAQWSAFLSPARPNPRQ